MHAKYVTLPIVDQTQTVGLLDIWSLWKLQGDEPYRTELQLSSLDWIKAVARLKQMPSGRDDLVRRRALRWWYEGLQRLLMWLHRLRSWFGVATSVVTGNCLEFTTEPAILMDVIGQKLPFTINTKLHTRFRVVPKWTTLDYLERPIRTLFQNTCVVGAQHKNLNEDSRLPPTFSTAKM